MVFIYILLAIFLFGVLIAVHEFGHFITAKLSGVRVNEFAIGMGPAVFKKQIGETLYALRILPFGGYCAMEGEDSESEDPRAFSSRPLLPRMLIVLAGSVMNLIAGFLVLAIVFAPVSEWQTPVVEKINFDGEITENMLSPGDVIKSVNGYDVYIFSDIQMGLMRGEEDGAHSFEVIRDGEMKTLSNLRFQKEESDSDLKGYTVEFAIEKTSFFGKAKFVFRNGVNLVRLVFVGLSDLISGNVSADEMSGPIGIGKVMVDTAKISLNSLFYLLAFISINLGVMNLLPLPALDGGRFFFLLIEMIFRKPVPAKYEAIVHMAGFILLMLLMLLITYNDIVKLFVK